eukprot:TRINITY_DN12985_c0_g1_i1.p1 TRINITY_DN12985_c0_g1~~TRINITY_DN12985_c0_g1_i1.p1  ORF type:complete len:335 (+),score=58.23 TRINITY_DN12985_c0_g1_i1:13-1017(+)
MYYVVFLLAALTASASANGVEGEEMPHLDAGGINIAEATGATLKDYTKDSWTILEFYSPICGHCRHFAPEFAKLSEYLAGIFTFVRVNVDEEREVANEWGITSVPKIYMFAPGRNFVPYPPERRTALKIVDWILETQDLPVFSLGDSESAIEFIYPPAAVYPARYVLVTKQEPAGDEFDTSDFPTVQLEARSIRATWVVKDEDSWNYTLPSLVYIPALEGETEVYTLKETIEPKEPQRDDSEDGEDKYDENDGGDQNSWNPAVVFFFLAVVGALIFYQCIVKNRLSPQHKRVPATMSMLSARSSGISRNSERGSIAEELTTVIWGDDEEANKID